MFNLWMVVLIILLIIAGGIILHTIIEKQKMQDSMETEKLQKQNVTSLQNGQIRIIISNETDKAHDADIWILQDNQVNRKTSSWGTAAANKLDIKNAVSVSVIESPDGQYLIRMIDARGLYYEANGILLKNGEKVLIKDGDDVLSAIVEVQDEEGKPVNSYDMFVASL